jgi:hypothetical protein
MRLNISGAGLFSVFGKLFELACHGTRWHPAPAVAFAEPIANSWCCSRVHAAIVSSIMTAVPSPSLWF